MAALLLASLALLVGAGCANPVSGQKVSFRHAFQEANANVLTSEHCSGATRLVLHRFNLEDRFSQSPVETLQELHRIAGKDERRDLVFALAELNYLHGRDLVQTRMLKPWVPKPARDYFLASAIYSYLYISSEGAEPGAPFKPEFRFACDLYNVALARAFIPEDNTNALMEIRAGTRALNPGGVRLELSRSSSPPELAEADRFFSADAFVVQGLTVHNVQGALGATLIAEFKTTNTWHRHRYFPATLILKFPSNLKEWSAGTSTAFLELSSGYDRRQLEIAGRKIPVRTDTTTPLAYSLNSSFVWKLGRRQFFSSEEEIRSDVYLAQPYQPGRVPVVFVHGTLSSPVWWAEMVNSLQTDPVLGERCQFWYYIYNSGNPVLLTAADFRASLTNAVKRIDPDGKDPALGQMVLIGHSQGGLLAKLAVINPGDRIWNSISRRPFDEWRFKDKDRAELERCLFFQPVPLVKRVVFISTPHRGSYLATAFVRNLAAKFMSLPVDVLRIHKDLLHAYQRSQLPSELRCIPCSLEGMSPHNPVLLAVADIPPAPGVTAHSIISVKGNGDPTKGNDGVVQYTSAHVPYVESEFIVRSAHSCQSNPATIEEVRRILLEHLSTLSSSPTSNPPHGRE